ncbi:MAG: hypothetical protein QOG80_1898 [Pseudonocardiales bacterium]|nr:hypothetical protein [Pseudonocardiales bacterium]
MSAVTESPAARPGRAAAASPDEIELNLLGSLAVALLVGIGLVVAARGGAAALLVAIAVTQALVGLAWIFGTSLPGRNGAVVIVALAAAGADVTVSIWPHGRLGTLLVVLGLAIPVMFLHQLARSAARVRVTDSLGAIALSVLAVVGLAALLQLRHEFASATIGGKVVAGVLAAAAGALVVGYLVDLMMPAPRFDPSVPRGLLAVVASGGVGGSIGHLTLHSSLGFLSGRGAFVGAAVGALAAFFAVAVAFVERSTPVPAAGFSRRIRPVLSAVAPIALLAPVAFLLCLAVRT